MSSHTASILSAEPLTSASSEIEIAERICSIRAKRSRRNDLVDMLRYGHPLYEGRGSNQIVRIRGYILASFETLGLPSGAESYVLEILENSQNAYLVAAAAKAIRATQAPDEQHVAYLVRAIENIQYKDDAISFESYFTNWPLQTYTTAMDELLSSLELFGSNSELARATIAKVSHSCIFSSSIRARANDITEALEQRSTTTSSPCCGSIETVGPPSEETKASSSIINIPELMLQNQYGDRQTIKDAIFKRPTVVAFFYTRCSNPNKCSLTVTMLGDVQRLLKSRGMDEKVGVAAITYDPGYDRPDRLLGYCNNRGFEFGQLNNAWRCAPNELDKLKAYFELGASYAGGIVSEHQVEAYLVIPPGEVRQAFTKLQWRPEAIVAAARESLASDHTQPR